MDQTDSDHSWFLTFQDNTIRTINDECLGIADNNSDLTILPCNVNNTRILWNWPEPIRGLHKVGS